MQPTSSEGLAISNIQKFVHIPPRKSLNRFLGSQMNRIIIFWQERITIQHEMA